MNLGFNASLAFLLGVLLPVLGLVRGQLTDDSNVWAFIADLICGGMLLLGAVKTRQRPHSGQRFLSAGYGLAFGLFYSNLALQLQPQTAAIVKPGASASAEWMIVPTIAGLLVAGVGLLMSLRSIRQK